MKKFSEYIAVMHEAETAEKSELQKSYAEYFTAKLKKFDAESPADLNDEQKKEFFNEITKDWDKGKGAKPAGKKDVEEHGVKESTESCPMCKKKDCECYKEKDANESADPLKVDPLNEAEIFIANDKFKDEAALRADIADNIAPAFNRLLSKNGIVFPPVTIKENRGSYQIESKPVTGKDLGIMQYGFKEVYIDSFGGGALPKISKDADGFEFTPIIWFNLHYSYNHGSADTSSQGSNGCALFLPGERTSNIWYDIVNGEFLKDSERQKFFDKNKY